MAIPYSGSGIDVPILIACLFALFVVYSLALAFYNLYLHPLAQFPGPVLSRAAHAPHFWSSFRGHVHKDLHALHEQYGDVVRIQPNYLTFASTQAWKDIYGSRVGQGQLIKDPAFYGIGRRKSPDIVYSNDADHARMRKLLSHAFSDTALREQESTLTPYFELLVTRLTEVSKGGKPVDLTKWYNYGKSAPSVTEMPTILLTSKVTFDIVADLSFGESFHALESGDFHSWVANIFKSVKFARILPIAAFYQPALHILRVISHFIPAIQKARKEHEGYTQLKTAARLDMKTNRKDFMTYILRHNDERGMSRDEIMGTSGVLIVAGSETTATLLSGATYHLLRNRTAYAKAQDEVRSAFAAPEEMTLARLAQLPYLQAVLEESLRVYPPVPVALPRRTPPEGAWIAGTWVPGNTSVAVPQWAINHSPQHWTNPTVFAPERWLADAPEEYAHDDRAARAPFSTGPRNCIGKNLAYNEMRAILARMLYHFDWTLEADSQDWALQDVFVFWDKKPLNVRLALRKF